MAALHGLPLDDTDEEWEQEQKETRLQEKKQLKSRFYYAMRAKIQMNMLYLLCI